MVGPLGSTDVSGNPKGCSSVGPRLRGGTIYCPHHPEKLFSLSKAHRHTTHSHRLLQKSRVMARLTHQLPASWTMLWPVSTGPGLCTGPTSPTVQSSTQPPGSSWSSGVRVETRRLSQERKEGCTYTAQVSGWWF